MDIAVEEGDTSKIGNLIRGSWKSGWKLEIGRKVVENLLDLFSLSVAITARSVFFISPRSLRLSPFALLSIYCSSHSFLPPFINALLSLLLVISQNRSFAHEQSSHTRISFGTAFPPALPAARDPAPSIIFP
jgi:hypothetical protein